MAHIPQYDGLPCVIAPGKPSPNGYARNSRADARQESGSVLAHVQTAWRELGAPSPDKPCACHTCDNRMCIRPSHLFWGTQADNLADMTAKSRRAQGSRVSNRGERNPRALVTEAQVVKIRSLYAAGDVSQQALGLQFGLSQQQVSNIVRRASW